MNSRLNYQGENIHLFKGMNRCNNTSFQELKCSVDSTFKFFFSACPMKELVASVTDIGLLTAGHQLR